MTKCFDRFFIDGVLSVSEEKPEFPIIRINNQYAKASISLYGGQVLSCRFKDSEDLLFLSDKAYYEKGKAIKGGIPVCWPWFGNDPLDEGRPAHGFARNTLWNLSSTEQLDNGSTKVIMTMNPSEQSKTMFPHDFMLTLIVSIGKNLTLELITENKSDQAIEITQALHTYFSVSNISEVAISGLSKISYLDKAKSNMGDENKIQIGDIEFSGEVDRIYLNVPNDIVLKPSLKNDDIAIKSKNSETVVVWNPWKDLCEKSGDLQDDDYMRFVCIETANAANEVVFIAAGESYSLTAEYSK